jgi:hypothetical protein
MGQMPFNGTPEEWDALVEKNKLHKCKYCGVETTQPDEECYAKPKQEYEYIGECRGNNGNGCFMDSCGHNCGCYVRIPKQEIENL